MSNAKAIFKKHLSGMNFMTPRSIEYGYCGEYVYELSWGEGFFSPKLYGVTLVHPDDGHDIEKSQAFSDLEDAKNYINSFKRRSHESSNSQNP